MPFIPGALSPAGVHENAASDATTASTVTVRRGVPFADPPERTLELDVYEPPAGGPAPAVLFVHGGSFVRGDVGQLARHALDAAERGFLAVEADYRKGGEATFPAALVDLKAAVEWVRTEGERYGADPERVGVVGHSAGANLAVLAALTADEPGFEPDRYPGASSRVDAVVGHAGVYDTGGLPPALARPYLGDVVEAVPEAVELSSPLGQAGPDAPPALLAHGVDDETVDPALTERMHGELSAVGSAAAELELFEGEGADHLFPHHASTYADVRDRTLGFLERHLGPAGGGADPDAASTDPGVTAPGPEIANPDADSAGPDDLPPGGGSHTSRGSGPTPDRGPDDSQSR